MREWRKWIVLGLALGAGAAHALVYTGYDGFSNQNGYWHQHETRAKVVITNGMLRISRNPSFPQYSKHLVQWSLNVAHPDYFYEDGQPCNGNDIFIATGLVRAPHGVLYSGRKYRLGAGFLTHTYDTIAITVEDSAAGRQLVAQCSSDVKSVPLPSSSDKIWLRVKYKAALKKVIFYWAPFTETTSPFQKFASCTVPDSMFWNGKLYLNPGVFGFIEGKTCPATWNVGMESFSYFYADQ